MGTVADRINKRRKKRLRGQSQVNTEVVVLWYQEGLEKFEKALLEYASWKNNTSSRFNNIQANQSDYSLPIGVSNAEDFYSIIQLSVAYSYDKNWVPVYRKCLPINEGDYITTPVNSPNPWYQIGAPIIKNTISKTNPRYVFLNYNHIRIFPTPKENITWGLHLVYNFMPKEVTASTNEATLNLPRYFFDAIEEYMTYCLIENENPELAAPYLAAFERTVHDNMYWLNKDQRVNEEEFANLAYYWIR